ncbi:MAG: DUF983 domain-containing protein [Caulobacteraceae bacterium]|nr:DUF983 domain-containing protein [Caulobacteraceae bacterium]
MTTPAARPNPILSGLAGRCPNCGQGALFAGFLAVAPTCQTCQFDLKAADPGDGPAVFVMLIGGFLVVFAALFVEVAYRPPIWIHLLVFLPLAGLVSLGLLRPVKGVLLAAQFHFKASQARHD